MRSTIFLIFILALVLRLGFIIFYENGTMLGNSYHASDEHTYNEIANNFLAGKGLVTDDGLYARRAPVYPLFLAITYRIISHHFVVIRLIQAFLASFTCILMYLLARMLWDENVAVISGIAGALYYPFIQQPAFLLTETVFTFLLMASAWAFIKYYYQQKKGLLILASLSLGLAILCRAVMLYFSIFLIIWLWVVQKSSVRKKLITIALMLLTLGAVILPWTLRNYRIYKAFIPVTIESGEALYFGNNPSATGGTGGWTKHEVDQFFPEKMISIRSMESDRQMYKLAIQYICAHPSRTVALWGKKLVNIWRPFYADARLMNKVIMSLMYIPIIVCAIAGIILSVRECDKKYSLLYALIAYFIVVHMVTISAIRYRDPVMPVIIIFASFGLLHLKQRLLTKKV